MEIKFDASTLNLVVWRNGDQKLYSETRFYNKLSHVLNACGFDMIRKQMWKDGCLVSPGQYYTVDRKRRFAWFQKAWGTYDICKDYYNVDFPIELKCVGDKAVVRSLLKNANIELVEDALSAVVDGNA